MPGLHIGAGFHRSIGDIAGDRRGDVGVLEVELGLVELRLGFLVGRAGVVDVLLGYGTVSDEGNVPVIVALGSIVGRLRGKQRHLVIPRVDLDEKLPLLDQLIIVDQQLLDDVGKLGADGNRVILDEGIVGRLVGRNKPDVIGCRPQYGQHRRDDEERPPPGIAFGLHGRRRIRGDFLPVIEMRTARRSRRFYFRRKVVSTQVGSDSRSHVMVIVLRRIHKRFCWVSLTSSMGAGI